MILQMIIFLSVVDIFVLVIALLTYYKIKTEIDELHGKISILHKRISTENAFLRMRVADLEEKVNSIAERVEKDWPQYLQLCSETYKHRDDILELFSEIDSIKIKLNLNEKNEKKVIRNNKSSSKG